MTKRDLQRLATLLKLAELKEQRAAQMLGEASQQLRVAEQHAQQLADYELEYAERLHQQGRDGVTPRALMNYDRFRNSLRGAHDQQLQAVHQAEAQRERARRFWTDQYARRRLLEQLRERRQLQHEQVAEKRLQNELDDLAARRLREPL